MGDLGYVRALERAEFIMGPPRIKGTVIWSDAGVRAARLLIRRFLSLVGERHRPAVVEHGFLADGESYRSVFGGYENVYEVASGNGREAGSVLRADNLVTTVADLRATGTLEPAVAVGGLLRRFEGRTPPLFRDRHIWPVVQLNQRVPRSRAADLLDFYRVVVERLLAAVGLPAVTVRTPALSDYGRVTYLTVSVLPTGRPTVLATLYLLADRLRHSLGEELDIVDVGFTGKLIATVAMLHSDQRGLALPSSIAPLQVGVTVGAATDMSRVDRWRRTLGEDGLRVRVSAAQATRSGRGRAERRWHRLGVPLVVGLDRGGRGEIIRATRKPLTRAPLSDLPGSALLRADLADHDARLAGAGEDVFTRGMTEGGHLRAMCEPCAGRYPVFGVVVPERRTRCDICRSPGARALFVSEEGRFY